MRTLRSLFVLGCCLATTLFAESPAESPAASAERVSLRVLAMEGMITDLAVATPQGRARLVARATAFGREVEARVIDGGVSFFRHGPPEPSTPTPSAVPQAPAARFAVQPGVDRYLVIVAARGTGDGRVFQVYAIPNSGEALPAKHARVINFTDGPLAVRLGAGSAVVGAAQSSVLACDPEADGHVALQLALPSTEEATPWRLASSTRVAVPGDRRLLMLITPTGPRERKPTGGVVMVEGGVLNIRIILDDVSTPAAAPRL